MTKQTLGLDNAGAPNLGTGAPVTLDSKIFVLSGRQIAEAAEAEITAYCRDEFGPTLEQYAVDHIVGGIVRRLR